MYTAQNKRYMGIYNEQGNSIDAALFFEDRINLISNADKKEGLIPVIYNLNLSPEKNWERIILLQIVTYMIKSDKCKLNTNIFKELTESDRIEIVKQIKQAFSGYRKVEAILKELKNDSDPKKYAKYSDAFVGEFSLGVGRHFESNKGSVQPRDSELIYKKKNENTLATPFINNFFFNIIMKDDDSKSFYYKYFNLIRTTVGKNSEPPGTDVPFNAVNGLDKDENELKKYRLNVRKIDTLSQFGGGCRMKGGAHVGDIVLLSIIPMYPLDGSINGIWLDRRQYISREILTKKGENAISNIGRMIYFRKPGEDKILIYGEQVDINNLIRDIDLRNLFNVDYSDIFESIVRDADSKEKDTSSIWKNNNINLTERMLRDASKWERIDNSDVKNHGNFIYKGGIEKIEPDENCRFIKGSVNRCMDILSSCAKGEVKEGEVSESCARIMDMEFDFDINPPMNDLADMVSKMNPKLAYQILRQFKFGSYLSDKDGPQPFQELRRFRVQSVADWLNEMGANTERCKEAIAPAEGQCNPKSLREQLGEDMVKRITEYANNSGKRAFFDYLQILVSWVNANPQVLNPEEFKNFEVGAQWPEINKSFDTYDYLNPYTKINIRMKSLSCGLERLKSSIINDTAGARGADVMSSIASSPLNIQIPFARAGFTYAVPAVDFGMMYGGAFDSELAFQDISKQYGYELFNGIFNYLSKTMSGLNNKMKLKSDTEQKIKSKLDNFRDAEEKLRKSLITLIERNQLYKASHGFINTYDMSDENFRKVLDKHSNLLNISSAYNRKARNLIDLFQVIAKAITDKIETSKPAQLSSEHVDRRPLAPTYYSR